ncbi:MAG: 6-bladed beta-propeller [Acidobacteriota bacterium]
MSMKGVLGVGSMLLMGAVLAAVSLALGVTPVPAADEPQWKGTIVKEGDVVVVQNPGEPQYKIPALELKEDFTLGGEAAGGAYVLNRPNAMALDAAGNLYVADPGERNIKIFDKNGKFVKTIGRAGQGPGEFRYPMGVTTIPGSAEIVVIDVQKIVIFDASGVFSRQIPLKGSGAGVRVDARGRLFVATSAIPSGDFSLKAYAPDMSRELAVVASSPEDPSRNPFRPRLLWILDNMGRVVFGDAKTYEFKIIDSQGKILKRFGRGFDPVRVRQEDKDDLNARTRKVLGEDAAKSTPYSSHYPAYRAFFTADGGRLFVETWEKTPDGKQDVYDIFDAEGRYLARVGLPLHVDFLNPRDRFIRDGKLYTIEPDDKGYEVVKRYTVTWKIPAPGPEPSGIR